MSMPSSTPAISSVIDAASALSDVPSARCWATTGTSRAGCPQGLPSAPSA
ncbi:MAG: hypothetical protein R2743_22585 [Ilumatobacteraceae bacterium]